MVSTRMTDLHVFFRQSARLLTLSFPHHDGPVASDPTRAGSEVQPVRMLVESLDAVEGLGIDFTYTAHLLADSARVKSRGMLGKLVCISLLRPDGSQRHFTGHCAEFELTRADQGVAHYRLVLKPWTHFLRHRVNDRLFLGQSIRQQVDLILSEHQPWADWRWELVNEEERIFTMAVQGGGVGESDHNYVYRRLEEQGLVTHFEHTADGHRLIIRNNTTLAAPIDGATADIRFQSAGGSTHENAISSLCPVRRFSAAHYAATSFDFKSPRPVQADEASNNVQPSAPAQEIHEYAGSYGFRTTQGNRFVRLRMEEIEARAKAWEGASNNYCVAPGRHFRLIDHFSTQGRTQDDTTYLLTRVHHSARNNYLQGAQARAEYENEFEASRLAVPWRPGRGLNSQPVKVLAPQTATVAGNEAAGSVDVDEYGRVRVVFHWDRERRQSARIRVSSHWAGGETGAVSHPRIGSEVLWQCLEGNPDHPVIVGVVYNGERMPPWQLPSQSALAGLRSRELAGPNGNQPGGKSNHVLIDDTAGQLQVQVGQDDGSSLISVGHVVRVNSTAGRKDQRGQGIEHRTDHHGVVRAAKGLLLTTESRPLGRAHMLDMEETIARLTTAREQHEDFAQGAIQADAQTGGDQDEVSRALKAQNDEIKGVRPPNPAAGRFPELEAPHLLLASPVGIESTTAGSTHQASDEHHAITSGAHTSISSGKSLLAVARQAVRLFAGRAGMRLIAAAGDIDVKALKDNINVLAKLNVHMEGEKIVIHARNEVEVLGNRQVTINGGTSYSRWNASGIEHGTHGVHREWAASHSLVGPKSLPLPGLQDMKTGRLPEPVCRECLRKAMEQRSALATRT